MVKILSWRAEQKQHHIDRHEQERSCLAWAPVMAMLRRPSSAPNKRWPPFLSLLLRSFVFVSSLLCLCLWPPLSSLFLRSFELLSQVCPLENDNSTLLVVLGGETAESGENKHSTSIEVKELMLMLMLIL